MRKIFLLIIFAFTTNGFAQTYSFNIKTGVLCNTCWDPNGPPGPTYDTFTASSFSWNLKNNGMVVASNAQSGYVPNGASITPYSNVTASLNSIFSISINSTGQVNYGSSSGSCNTNNTVTKSLEDLIIDSSMGFSDSPCGISALITAFKPNVIIQNNNSDTICSGEQLNLVASSGFPNVAYHWQYSKDNQITWIDVPLTIGTTNTNNTPQTYFSINDLLGDASEQYFNEQIYFRLGYGQNRPFSNVIPITFSPCAPVIKSIAYEGPKCSGDILQKIEVTFDRDLKLNESIFPLYILDTDTSIATPFCEQKNRVTSLTLDPLTKEYKYSFIKLNRLISGHTYVVKYQAFFNTTPMGVIQSTSPFLYTEIDPITFDVTKTNNTKTNILCKGKSTGSITVEDPKGGNGGYSYSNDGGTSWQTSPTFSGLKAGTYPIKIKDKLQTPCTSVAVDIALSEPTQAIEIDGTPDTSNATGFERTDGSISIFFKNGTGTYTYTWTKDPTNPASNTPATVPTPLTSEPDWDKLGVGYYTITANSGGCSSEPYAFTITQPNQLEVSITGNAVLCNGNGTGALSVVETKGGTVTTGYTYEWFKKDGSGNFYTTGLTGTTGASGIFAGVYKVKVSDNALPVNIAWSNEFKIIQPPTPLSASASKTNVTCNGANNGEISVSIIGGTTGYSILWNDGIETQNRIGLPVGSYYYTVTDANNCQYNSPSNITITQPSLPTVNSINQTQPSSPTAQDGSITITATGGTGSYTYTVKKGTETKEYTSNSIPNLENGTYEVWVKDANGCLSSKDTLTLEALNVSLISKNNILCHGDATGNITVSASGGTLLTNTNYSYKWFKNGSEIIGQTNSTINGLTFGDYFVQITDDKTTIQSPTYTLTQPSNPLTVTSTLAQQHNQTCSDKIDGAIEITVSGGTGAYNYAWNNSKTTKDISGLFAGTYYVTVTDGNNCTKTLTGIEITQPSPITLPQESITPVLINGQSTGAISFASDPTGGNGGYTYNWTSSTDTSFTPKTTKNISSLKAGFYTLEIKDSNQCSASKTFEVTESPLLQVIIKESSAIKCNGNFNGELQAIVTGGIATYNYQWFKNGIAFGDNSFEQKGLEFGDYKVIVTDFVGATKTANLFTLKQPNLLTVTAASQTNVLCHNANTGAIDININGGTPPYTQQWTKEGLNYSTNKNLINLGAGTYQVVVTDAVGHNCTASLSPAVIITQPTNPLAINDLDVKDLTGFETLNGSIKVNISGGTSPYKYTFGSQSNVSMVGSELLLDKLPTGSYTLTITDANGCSTFNNYNLTQPDKLVITTIAQTPASAIKCYGDKFAILEATITGGVLPYTYNWYNILTPAVTVSASNPSETLIAGAYELKVTDANGNTFTLQSNPVIEPPLLKINFTPKNVSCKNGNDGSITISTSGGTGTSVINWSTGENTSTINNLYAGDYSVSVTDKNQCQSTETIAISEPDILYVSKITKNPPSALGLQDGSIEIQLTGGTPNYNYLWYNGNKDLIYSDLNQPFNTSINNIYAGQYFVTVKDANGCAIIEKDLDKIDPLVLSINQINIVKCNGDATASIKATASGGTPIYYYKWYKTTDPINPVGIAETLTNATAGTYYVVLSDSFGLTKQSENRTITEPSSLNNTLTSEYTSCGDAKDWSITTVPSGGTEPYTYLWNTSARTANLQDVIPNNYSVLVTDNHGCTLTKNITITSPVHLATAETITKPTCFEGSDATIVLTSTGGQGPYSYLWNTGEKSNVLSNASAKEYTVAVTDFKGCVINRTYTIENPPKDVINLGEDVTLCFDQSLTINATITDDKAKYSWISTKGFASDKPIITVSEAADYTLVVTNKLGCKASDTLKIESQNTAINAEFAASSQVFLNEKFIIVDISNPIADSIEWILPAEATVVSKNKNYAELSFNKVGEYELTLNTRKGNCTATQTKKIIVVEGEYTNPDSTDLKKKFDLKIYPNPSNGIFTVDVTLDKVMPAHIKVYNLTNNMIIDSKYEEGKDAYKFNFSLSGLSSGVYFVLVESQQGNQLRKVIIQ